MQKLSLASIDVFNAYDRPSAANMKGSGYTALSAAQKELRIKQAARVMASEASNGIFTGILTHNATDLNQQEFQWLLDELAKYRSVNNITINTFANMIGTIKTSGNWSDSGNNIWTRAFSGSDTLSLQANSPLINAGRAVSGRTADILGNPIVGNPDIGAYEYQTQAPSGVPVPTLLTQFRSNGTTAIAQGGWTNEPNVLLKFSMTSNTTPDSLTPQVEVRPNTTAFTGVANYLGSLTAYTGSAVDGTVAVNGLIDGVYHWQASVKNGAEAVSPFAILGGNPDFGVDTTSPSAPLAKNKPTWNWEVSTDTTSGLADPAYTIMWCSEAGFAGCEGNVASTNSTSYTHATALTPGAWYAQVRSADKAGNSSAYTFLGSVIVQ